jgi:hypothetical protein
MDARMPETKCDPRLMLQKPRLTAFAGLIMTLLVSASCDGQQDPGARQTTKIAIANPYHDKLMGLSVLNRSLGLRRAIQDASQGCARITASGYQAPYKGLHVWIGRCAPEGDYAVFIAPSGDAQVRRCKDVQTLMLPACRTDSLDTVPRITAG